MTLVITDAGLQEIGVEPGESASSGKSKPRAMAKPPPSRWPIPRPAVRGAVSQPVGPRPRRTLAVPGRAASRNR